MACPRGLAAKATAWASLAGYEQLAAKVQDLISRVKG